MSDEKAHAKYSASGSSRWLNCSGSISLCEKAPPQADSPYAKEGTEAHACLEFLLKNRTNMDAALSVVSKKYSDEMVKHALSAARWILERLEEEEGADFHCETQVDASPFTCEGQFGTLDAAIAAEYGRLTVIDYKYGAGVSVSPEGDGGRGNPQMVYYALGLSHLYHHNFSEVELVVIQPRAYHESGETIHSFVMSMDDLLSWGEVFKSGVIATQNPNAPTTPGTWCRFCPAASICPELKTKALAKAQIVFEDETGLEMVPEPTMISLPNLGTILDACERLEDWISAVRDHAYHVLSKGETIEGFKLVDKRSPRKWANESQVTIDAKNAFGDDAFTKPEILSPAQLEKVVKKFMDKEKAQKWIDARTTTKSSGTTLVRSSDKRPAVGPGSAFADAPIIIPLELPRNTRRVVKK